MRPWDKELVKNYKYTNNYCNSDKICQISSTTVKEDIYINQIESCM